MGNYIARLVIGIVKQLQVLMAVSVKYMLHSV